MSAIIVFFSLSILLLIGKILRIYLAPLQRLYLPSSVIGGIVGLAAINIFKSDIPFEYISCAKSIPGFLINIIFASLFLGAVTPKLKEVFSLAFPQLCLGQMMAWGQYVIGLGIAGFIFFPLFGINPAFGNLLEIGFEGGHGTVGGLTTTFENFNWHDGIALGYTMATIGMVLGITFGMALVNWAMNKSFVKSVRSFNKRKRNEKRGIYLPFAQPDAGKQTVFSDSIDSLAWHLALIGLAIFIGFVMLKGLCRLEVISFPDAKVRIFSGFPLFPLCMIGGVIIQLIAQKSKFHILINHGQMQHIAGAALDYLVVSAVATIELKVVMDNALFLVILSAAGLLWGLFLVIFVAPKLFRNDWFERAIAEFGQALGVTATGLMLLRSVDPENKTSAAASFGYKQLFHEPFMGGGLWTALALTLVFTVGWLPVFIFSASMLILWAAISMLLICKHR